MSQEIQTIRKDRGAFNGSTERMYALASAAQKNHLLYRPDPIHPEFMLATLARYDGFPEIMLQGDGGWELQRQVIDENYATIATMLPDIVDSNAKLRNAGYMHTVNPHDITSSPEGLIATGREFSSVIYHTYPDGNGGTRYPLKIKNPEAVTEQIRKRELDVYTVRDQDGIMIAGFGIVYKKDILGRGPHAIELGRTGILASRVAELEEKGVSVRGMSKLRLFHILTQPEFYARSGNPVNFIYTDNRLSSTWNDEFQGGRGVQGVFYGGRAVGEQLGFGIGTVGYRYRMGERTEPFSNSFRPLLPVTYAEKLQNTAVFIPDPEDAAFAQVLLSENFGVAPEIRHNGSHPVQPLHPTDIRVSLNYDPSSSYARDVFAQIDVVDTHQETHQMITAMLPTMSLADALSAVASGRPPSTEVYIEATLGDEVTEEKITRTVATLKELGFVFNGWLPSNRRAEGIMWSFARTEKEADPVQEDMPERYYQNGLENSRVVAQQILANLRTMA